MKFYALHDSAGEIVQTGFCPDDMLSSRVPLDAPDLKSIECPAGASCLTHKVINGTAVPRTEADVAKRTKAHVAAMESTGLSKTEKILAHLKAKGIDLGPHGEHL